MASGSQNMTTYNARTVTGSNSAASPAGALLLSGADRADNATGDTWIFLDSAGGTSTPWGIKHDQANNKIQIFGAGKNSVWTEMNTGNTYIGGSLNTGSTLTVRAQNDAHEGGEIILSPATSSFSTVHIDAYDSMFRLHDGTNESFKVNISTGNATVIGKLGVGSDQAILNDSYRLYVNGNSYFTDHMYIGRSNSAHIYLINKNWTKGTNPSSQTYSAVEYNDVNNGRIALLEATLDTSGNSQFNIFLVPNVASSTAWSGIILQKTNANVLTVSIAGATTVNGHLFLSGEYSFYTKIARKVDGGGGWAYSPFYVIDNANTIFARVGVYGKDNTMNYMYIGTGDYNTTTHIRIDSSGHLVIPNDGIYYQGTKEKYRMIRFIDNTADVYGNGISIGGGGLTVLGSGESSDTILNNLSLTAAGGTETTYIGSDGSIIFYPNNNSWDASAAITMTASRFWAGVNGNTAREAQVGVQSGAGQLYMWSHAATSGSRGIYTPAHGSGGARAIFSVDTNNRVYFADSYTGASTALAYSQSGLAASAITWLTCWNGYELRAISKAEVANAVDGAHKWVRIGGDTMTGLLKISLHSNTVTIGSQNTGFCHITSSANVPFWFNRQVTIDGDLMPYTSNTRAFGNASCEWNSGAIRVVYARHYDSSIGYTGDQNIYFGYNRGLCHYFYTCNNGSSRAQRAYIDTQGVHNAVWNDFAEYRKSNCTEGGRVVVDDGSGTMNLCNERLAKGARIISDTFGCSVGYSIEQNTPIGVGGRVLAYPYQSKEHYSVGDAVCAAPNGTIDLMTREEIINYPDRIIGIVSEIPTYETWSQQASEDSTPIEIQVNGRIWIYVR